MSNKSLRGSTDYAAPSMMHKPTVAAGRAAELYVTDSPALGSDLAASGEDSSPATKLEATVPRRGQTRAIWFLSGWLLVSMAMISVAGVVIARYF